MYYSLNKFKELPKETKVYCGHEYTLQNSVFCATYDKNNDELNKKIMEVKSNEIKTCQLFLLQLGRN